MTKGYFELAWTDIRMSPGFFGKMILLALISFIPVFGWIVVYGYAFGWAREIAWGVRTPLPARIFDNSDGGLYRRGFFVLLISFLFSLIPLGFSLVGHAVVSLTSVPFRHFGLGISPLSPVITLLTMLLSLAIVLPALVGMMRMSIYRRLAPGLQLNKIAIMMKHDIRGLLRILGMSLLISLCAAVLGALCGLVLVLLLALVAALVIHASLIAPALIPLMIVVILALLVCALVAIATLSVFSALMVARALGYWVQQFDVPHWRGQDDPLPCEYQQ